MPRPSHVCCLSSIGGRAGEHLCSVELLAVFATSFGSSPQPRVQRSPVPKPAAYKRKPKPRALSFAMLHKRFRRWTSTRPREEFLGGRTTRVRPQRARPRRSKTRHKRKRKEISKMAKATMGMNSIATIATVAPNLRPHDDKWLQHPKLLKNPELSGRLKAMMAEAAARPPVPPPVHTLHSKLLEHTH